MPKVTIITAARLKDEQDIKWFDEAIESVQAQTEEDWLWHIVNDHSEVDFPDVAARDERIVVMTSEKHGVSAARNMGIAAAPDGPILCLDHDDKLSAVALERFLRGMEEAQDALNKPLGHVIYSDTLIVQRDSQRYYASPDYSLAKLLKDLIMPVGSLHLKSAWEAVGGFKEEMEFGLEDHEYWINMGRHDICGYVVHEPLYTYRFHERGRRAFLADGRMATAQKMIRDIHQDLYGGDMPAGCCGGTRPTARSARPGAAPSPQVSMDDTNFKNVIYGGELRGFYITGRATQIRYWVESKGKSLRRGGMAGQPGVHINDLPQLARYGPGVYIVQ